MKLDLKCVRDSLIALEEMSDLDNNLVPKVLYIEDFLENSNINILKKSSYTHSKDYVTAVSLMLILNVVVLNYIEQQLLN